MALTTADAAHLLRRTGFGVTPSGLAGLRSLGSREAAVARVLDTSASPSDLLAPALPLDVPLQGFANLLAQWWFDRMATSPTPLVEKLTLLWHSHFVSAHDKVPNLGLLHRQNRTLRAGALGSFHDLVQAVSVDPAMLIYLDNWQNVAGSAQENFGRELLEVFTLGVSQRDEADVPEMARAWTGHGLTGDRLGYEFHPDQHDSGPKSLFGLPPRAWNGPDALSELVLRSRADECARFVTSRVVSFLAFPAGIDDPFVGALADRFRRSRFDLRSLVGDILRSEEFWGPRARYALVRSPVEWMVASMQAIGQGALLARPDEHGEQLGQILFDPPTVAGWGQNGYWVSTAGAWGKAEFALQLRGLAQSAGILKDVVDRAPADVASRGFEQFGIVEPSAATRAVVERWAARTREEGKGSLLPRNLVHLMLLTPEFQLA